MNFFKIFRVVGMLSAWMEKAVLDGVIDQDEMIELVQNVLYVLDIKASIKVE